MKLSDVMSHSGLAGYAQVALVIFIVVFVAIVIGLFLPSRKRELEESSRLPFDDGEPDVPDAGASR